MVADRGFEAAPRPSSASEAGLDPETLDFIAACLAVSNESAATGLDPAASVPQHRQTTDVPQPDTLHEAETRAELEALRAQFTHLKVGRDESVTALESRSERAIQDRAALADALATISSRDSTIEQLRRIISERDSEIAELQQHVLQVEEARTADATAFLESLDKHRT